ncbi:MAG: PEP-CTERM sorting domain-containing protein [Candidatus Sulfotelmatobacter sp.]
MRKQIIGVAMLVLLVAFGVATASAQVDIGLGFPNGGGSSGNVTFTGTGSGNDSLSFGGCPANSSGNCWSGSTTGSAGPYSMANDFWEINFAGITVNMDSLGNITQSAGAALTLGTTNGGLDLLTGSLQLVSFSQTLATGGYNDALVANLTNLGGTLAPYFYNGTGVTQITIDFNSTAPVIGLPLGSPPVTGTYSSGELTSTPEPSSLLLLGSGLMVFGGILRRKLFA